MVRPLERPTRPLVGGLVQPWQVPWVRIYHRDRHTPSGTWRRIWGPTHRFDHHDPTDPSVIYLAKALRSCGAEVFADRGVARVCPSYRAAWIVPESRADLQDLQGSGAMLLGALPGLGSGEQPLALTQEWARAIYEDRPARLTVCGVHYTGAHEEGECACVWDTGPPVRLLASASRGVEDRPLLDPGVFPIFFKAMDEVGLPVERIPSGACIPCMDNAGF